MLIIYHYVYKIIYNFYINYVALIYILIICYIFSITDYFIDEHCLCTY
jgi:hypothetical protein